MKHVQPEVCGWCYVLQLHEQSNLHWLLIRESEATSYLSGVMTGAVLLNMFVLRKLGLVIADHEDLSNQLLNNRAVDSVADDKEAAKEKFQQFQGNVDKAIKQID
jgi:hypothetical protein